MFCCYNIYNSLVRVVKEAVSSSAAAMREGSNPLDYTLYNIYNLTRIVQR